MNPIDELRAARPAHLGDQPVDERTRAAELTRAMAAPRQSRQSRRTRRVVRPVWSLGLAGAAAATAAAVVITSNGAQPVTPRTTPATSALATTQATVRLSARDVLLAAAGSAESRPEGRGAYWHTTSVSRNLYVAEKGGYRIMDVGRSEMWTPRATGGETWSRGQSLGAHPVTDEDRAAWEQAGSPSEITVAAKMIGGTKRFVVPMAEGKVRTEHAPLLDGDKVFWLGRNITMKDLRRLPADPARLKKWLEAAYDGHGTESTDEEMSAHVWLFKVGVGLVTDMPVTPEVRGAAFRMLAGLDGVRVTENVTDSEGRRGTAVSVTEDVPGPAVLEDRLVFDVATGRALARENVVVKPGGLQAGLEPGTVWNSTALLDAGWTDANFKG